MDEVAIEHRLTRIEEQQAAGFERMETRAKTIEVEITGVRREFARLNGTMASTLTRVEQLEQAATTSDAERAYIKRWGSRATALIVVMVGLTSLVDILTRAGGLGIPGLFK